MLLVVVRWCVFDLVFVLCVFSFGLFVCLLILTDTDSCDFHEEVERSVAPARRVLRWGASV